MRVVLLGPPGAGKGSLAKAINQKHKVAHISTGDMLREEMKNESTIGLEIKKIVEKGELVPDEIVTKLIEQTIANDETVKHGFMFDGFPRTVAQAESLDKILEKASQGLDAALNMDTNLEMILKRLTGRRVCKQCGALYHVTNKPPQKEGTCDNCGGTDLYQRADDNEETIKTRMDVYSSKTKPIIDYYAKQDKIINIDGDKETLDLLSDVEKIFNDNFKFNKDKVTN